MKIKLLTNIDFEYGGVKKTRFAAGSIFTVNRKAFKWTNEPGKGNQETTILDGYWIGNERGPKSKDLEAPGSLIETKCLLEECEVVEE